jgi:hypothetical protein
LLDLLEEEPKQCDSLGKDYYKIRVSIASKGKGKSGGARVIYFVRVDETRVVLLAMFDKSEQDNLSNKELEELLKII